MLSTFPTFSRLPIDEKTAYHSATADYPPYSDILFTTLHIWWNLNDQLRATRLNENLVLRYHLDFDEINSGYSLIGTNLVDDSIQTLFNYLETQHQPLKLVHVPQFTVDALQNKDDYTITEELDYAEYILDAPGLAQLEGSRYGHIRTQINRFLREVEGKKVEHKILDLNIEQNRDDLYNAIVEWEASHPPRNDPDRTEHEALKKTLANADALDIKNHTLFIDDKIHGFTLYHTPVSNDYYVIHHMRFDYTLPYTSDFMIRHLARDAQDQGVPYLNMEMDLGSENLRRHKQKLVPVNMFRKYTITPR